mmetsp:Transcript_55354/g.111098  ORF Transcript_55354/g.111098 Transcript_55354/m.111098 type:complete len:342 (-) Transcript_55354:5-1030(-)
MARDGCSKGWSPRGGAPPRGEAKKAHVGGARRRHAHATVGCAAAAYGAAWGRRCWRRRCWEVRRRAAGSESWGDRPESPALSAAVALSALFMVLWVFLLPGSAWVGSFPERDSWISEFYRSHFQFFAPASIILKYNVVGPLIELTHALPGAIWCLLAPLQLSPEARKVDGGSLHRTAGRVMLLAATVLMVGYALIDGQHLFADEVDFVGHGGGLADAANAFNAGQLGGVMPPFNLGGVRFLAAWFVVTAVQTFRTATAEPRDVASHRCWALRHMAAGLWVAAQRPLFAAARVVQGLLLGTELAAAPSAQADAFYYCAYLTTALYIFAAEWAISNGDRGHGP